LAYERTLDERTVYEIRVKGWLEIAWSEWFQGLSVTQQPGGYTLLTGPVLDQAELHGILNKVRDLGLALISVQRCDPDSSVRLGDAQDAGGTLAALGREQDESGGASRLRREVSDDREEGA
jgi:hypothetical protein